MNVNTAFIFKHNKEGIFFVISVFLDMPLLINANSTVICKHHTEGIGLNLSYFCISGYAPANER